MLLTERGRHWTGDAREPVARARPVIYPDGGMLVSVVRQGFFDKHRNHASLSDTSPLSGKCR